MAEGAGTAKKRKNTVAVLGGRGMLGTDVVRTCRQRGLDVKVFDLPDFDITNTEQLRHAVNQAGIIVNCAAYTNVDGAEDEAGLAYKVNAEAVGTLAALAAQTGVWVLHISTDFVFDGQPDRPYCESDLPNPINTYGKTKLAGEELLAKSGAKHCIVRLQWTYGSAGNNFITKLISRAKQGRSLRVVDDQIGSPTATTEAARVISKLLLEKPEGLFHFAASGYVSRFDLAKFVFDKLRMSVNLSSCKSSDYVTPAARPLNSRFNCSKVQALLDEPIRKWQEPLAHFLETL